MNTQAIYNQWIAAGYNPEFINMFVKSGASLPRFQDKKNLDKESNDS